MIIPIHLPSTDQDRTCSECGELRHHGSDCPAHLSPKEALAQLIETRKALAKAQEELAGWQHYAAQLGVSEPQHLDDILLTKAATEQFLQWSSSPLQPRPKSLDMQALHQIYLAVWNQSTKEHAWPGWKIGQIRIQDIKGPGIDFGFTISLDLFSSERRLIHPKAYKTYPDPDERLGVRHIMQKRFFPGHTCGWEDSLEGLIKAFIQEIRDTAPPF